MAAVTYLEAIRQGIWEEMERDSSVFVLGEDVGIYGGAFKLTEGMLERFGEDRVVDTPISESAIVGAAIGAALMGMRPIAEMQFADFISCAFDQITNFAAKCRYRWGAGVPMVIRGPSGGGIHGGPYHSQNPEMHYVHTPGLKVVAPSTVYDAKGLIKAAIRDEDPVVYFEHKFLYRRLKEELPEGDWTVPIGKADIKRAGSDISVITYGAMVHLALEAAATLGQRWDRAGSRRSANSGAAGQGARSRLRQENQQGDSPARRRSHRRYGWRTGRHHCRGSLRIPGWPDHADYRTRHTGSL